MDAKALVPARRPLVGVACVLGAAALWGTTGTAQALAGGSLPAAWFGAWRLVFAALFFAAYAAATGGFRRATWQGLPRAEALGAGLGMAVYNLAFFAGAAMRRRDRHRDRARQRADLGRAAAGAAAARAAGARLVPRLLNGLHLDGPKRGEP